MEEILQMSALELSKQIRHGSVSVKEAVEACFAQIDKVEKRKSTVLYHSKKKLP